MTMARIQKIHVRTWFRVSPGVGCAMGQSSGSCSQTRMIAATAAIHVTYCRSDDTTHLLVHGANAPIARVRAIGARFERYCPLGERSARRLNSSASQDVCAAHPHRAPEGASHRLPVGNGS